MRRKFAFLAVACLALLVVAGCGSSKKKSAKTTTTTKTTQASANRTLSLPKKGQPASATAKPTAGAVTAVARSKAPSSRKAALKGLEGKSLTDKLQLFASDAGGFWQAAFTRAKAKFDPATVNIVADQQSTQCKTVKSTDDPIYCAGDSSIDLPVDFFTKLDQDPKFSDPGVLALVGFYWGLHVENQIGMLNKSGVTGPQIVQGAFCLDGVYISSVGGRKLLDPGDLDKMANVVAAGGDAPGTPTDKSVGSPQDLVKAFATGVSGGKCQLA